MKKLLFLLLIIVYSKCNAQTKDTYIICENALEKIKAKDYQGFKNMFHTAVIKNANDIGIQKLVDQAAEFINKYGIPAKEMIMVKNQITYTQEGPVQILSLDYPFPAPKEKYTMPERVISFGFTEKFGMDSLSSFNIRDYAASDSMMTTNMRKIPFLEKLSFNEEDISWFRIYYSKGKTNKNIGNEDGVFAVSGNNIKLAAINITENIEKIFALLEKAEIEKTNYKYGGAFRNNGNPEYIYYRFRFNKPVIENLDELTIYTVIEEEKGVKEDDFIVVSHSQMNRYFISKSKNPELFNALKELAYKNYGNALEKNP